MVELQTIFQLILATFLGFLIGLEREAKNKEAGLQTYSLVALSSCFFTIISFEMVEIFIQEWGMMDFDPTRIIQAVAVGIGFIGAGAIFRHPSGVAGLTTAAGLWTVASIGIAVGIKAYFLSIFVTILALLVLFGFGLFEKTFFRKKQ